MVENAFIEWEDTPVRINKLTITDIARTMTEIIKCDPFKAVYFRGKMISPTLPSSFMAF